MPAQTWATPGWAWRRNDVRRPGGASLTLRAEDTFLFAFHARTDVGYARVGVEAKRCVSLGRAATRRPFACGCAFSWFHIRAGVRYVQVDVEVYDVCGRLAAGPERG